MTRSEFFFDRIWQLQHCERMKENALHPDEYPLSLASNMMLPWLWSLSRYVDNLSRIGTDNVRP